MRNIVIFILVTAVLFSLAAPVMANWQGELSRAPVAKAVDRNRPSFLDLAEISSSIDYPNDDDYLDEYRIRYIRSSRGEHSVYALHGLNDGANWEKLAREIENNTRVVIIAEHSYVQNGMTYTYCCGIYNRYGCNYSGWINKKYLVSEPVDYNYDSDSTQRQIDWKQFRCSDFAATDNGNTYSSSVSAPEAKTGSCTTGYTGSSPYRSAHRDEYEAYFQRLIKDNRWQQYLDDPRLCESTTYCDYYVCDIDQNGTEEIIIIGRGGPLAEGWYMVCGVEESLTGVLMPKGIINGKCCSAEANPSFNEDSHVVSIVECHTGLAVYDMTQIENNTVVRSKEITVDAEAGESFAGKVTGSPWIGKYQNARKITAEELAF